MNTRSPRLPERFSIAAFERMLARTPRFFGEDEREIFLPTEYVGIIVPRARRTPVAGGYICRFDRQEIADMAADALLDPNQGAEVVKRKIALCRALTTADEWTLIEQQLSDVDAAVRGMLDLPPGMEPLPV